MRVIYIDILFLLNFYITYFLIIGTGCITHRRIKAARKILGSTAGAVGSFVILLPPMPFIFGLLGKLMICLLITLAAFGFGGIKRFIKSALVFLGINCVYAGIMLALWLFVAPSGMMYNNGVSYFQIPVWAIVAFTSAAYLILKLIGRIMDSGTDFDRKYTVEISTESGSVRLNAIADSGNKLVEFFSGLPVIFCDFESCRHICPCEIACQLSSDDRIPEFIRGVRLVPCSTVSGSGTAFCFKPKKILICQGKSEKQVNALIGFTKSGLNTKEFEAIFNPNILNFN
ncbi:MAG: sigma-E processing peptidase SpoIIGA [Firmicutes bacterium]|nr:sigma-E processing peptidase SpoIIGA [[Eubacterium] siraeum]MCM1488727.1 sigma-E processing peptidase SpoIIGA [Bacillota bacterium]